MRGLVLLAATGVLLATSEPAPTLEESGVGRSEQRIVLRISSASPGDAPDESSLIVRRRAASGDLGEVVRVRSVADPSFGALGRVQNWHSLCGGPGDCTVVFEVMAAEGLELQADVELRDHSGGLCGDGGNELSDTAVLEVIFETNASE